MSKKLSNEIFLFICQGQVDTWHHLKGRLEPSPFNNMEFNDKIIISHELSHFVWRESISHGRAKSIPEQQQQQQQQQQLFGPFRMTVRNFCIFMRNQLRHPPYTAVNFPPLVHFAQSCQIFGWSYEFAIFWFWAPFDHFFHFLLLTLP